MMAASHSSIKKTNQLFDDAIDPVGLIYIAMSDVNGQVIDKNSENIDINALDFLMERLPRN